MIIALLTTLLLLVLGLLAAEPVVTQKVPATRNIIAAASKHQEVLGIVGLVLGLFGLIMTLTRLGALTVAPLQFIIGLVANITIIGLGLIYGLGMVRRNLKDTSSPLFQKVEGLRVSALRYQQNLGLTAIVIGLFNLIVLLTH